MARFSIANHAAIALASVSSAGIAHAQAADPAAADATPVAPATAETPPEPTDNAIIVTALRRDERLQDVPLSISAFNEQSLEVGKAENIAYLNAMVPKGPSLAATPSAA